MFVYKVWVHIERIDEENDVYEDVEDGVASVGGEFETEEEARNLQNMIVDAFN